MKNSFALFLIISVAAAIGFPLGTCDACSRWSRYDYGGPFEAQLLQTITYADGEP